MEYPEVELPEYLQPMSRDVERLCGFSPNSCLLNFYPDGDSTLGFHSDQVDKMEGDTGICIVSVGAPRVLRFKSISDPSARHDVVLKPGSALLMTRQNQLEWKRAVPKSPG